MTNKGMVPRFVGSVSLGKIARLRDNDTAHLARLSSAKVDKQIAGGGEATSPRGDAKQNGNKNPVVVARIRVQKV